MKEYLLLKTRSEETCDSANIKAGLSTLEKYSCHVRDHLYFLIVHVLHALAANRKCYRQILLEYVKVQDKLSAVHTAVLCLN